LDAVDDGAVSAAISQANGIASPTWPHVRRTPKPHDKSAAKLDDGWKNFIGKALKKCPRKAQWLDPVGEEKWKPGATKKAK
jgi:hypothetical protein